jgi:hypothetical protein
MRRILVLCFFAARPMLMYAAPISPDSADMSPQNAYLTGQNDGALDSDNTHWYVSMNRTHDFLGDVDVQQMQESSLTEHFGAGTSLHSGAIGLFASVVSGETTLDTSFSAVEQNWISHDFFCDRCPPVPLPASAWLLFSGLACMLRLIRPCSVRPQNR